MTTDEKLDKILMALTGKPCKCEKDPAKVFAERMESIQETLIESAWKVFENSDKTESDFKQCCSSAISATMMSAAALMA